MIEKRKLARFSLQLLARVFIGDERKAQKRVIELLSSNISAGGAFFQTDQPLSVGTRVELDVLLPLERIKKADGKMVCVKMSGSIIRSDEKGMAISFDEDYEIVPLK